MALNSLRLTDPKYAWVVRPVEAEEVTFCVSYNYVCTKEPLDHLD